MSAIQIYVEDNETAATLTKGYLESYGIKASIGPVGNFTSDKGYLKSSNQVSYGVYVGEKDVEVAKNILQERIAI